MQINGITVTPNQAAVYNTLKNYGPIPDHALVPLAQHAATVHQSSSGIRTRRSELTNLGLIKETGKTRTGSGRRASIYGVS